MSVFGAKKVDEPQVSRPISPEVPRPTGQPSSLIGRTLFVKGEVISEDDVIIDGHVEGTIKVKNRLTIGKNAVIKAEIEASVAIIEGTIEGNVSCKSRVEIAQGGTLRGNITSTNLIISEGGFFEGSVEMKGRQEKTSSKPEITRPSGVADAAGKEQKDLTRGSPQRK